MKKKQCPKCLARGETCSPPVSKKRRIQKKWRKKHWVQAHINVFTTDLIKLNVPNANGVIYKNLPKGPHSHVVHIHSKEEFDKIYGGKLSQVVSMGFKME